MGVLKNLEAEFDSEIVDEFVDHYEMMADVMEMLVLSLSRPDQVADSVEQLFRIMHNIKSASGFLQIIVMNKLSTFVENHLEILRAEPKSLSEESVSWFLRINDQYQVWLEDIQHDRSDWTRLDREILNVPSELEK